MKGLYIGFILVAGIRTLPTQASDFSYPIKKRIQNATGPKAAETVAKGRKLLDLDSKMDILQSSINEHRRLIQEEEGNLVREGIGASEKVQMKNNIKQLREVIDEMHKEMSRLENQFSNLLIEFNTLAGS